MWWIKTIHFIRGNPYCKKLLLFLYFLWLLTLYAKICQANRKDILSAPCQMYANSQWTVRKKWCCNIGRNNASMYLPYDTNIIYRNNKYHIMFRWNSFHNLTSETEVIILVHINLFYPRCDFQFLVFWVNRKNVISFCVSN